jgi:hypothetical protein
MDSKIIFFGAAVLMILSYLCCVSRIGRLLWGNPKPAYGAMILSCMKDAG